jgi:hypothetical protein
MCVRLAHRRYPKLASAPEDAKREARRTHPQAEPGSPELKRASRTHQRPKAKPRDAPHPSIRLVRFDPALNELSRCCAPHSEGRFATEATPRRANDRAPHMSVCKGAQPSASRNETPMAQEKPLPKRSSNASNNLPAGAKNANSGSQPITGSPIFAQRPVFALPDTPLEKLNRISEHQAAQGRRDAGIAAGPRLRLIPVPKPPLTPLQNKQATPGTIENALARIRIANPKLTNAQLGRMHGLLFATIKQAGGLSAEFVDSIVASVKPVKGRAWSERGVLNVFVNNNRHFMQRFLAGSENVSALEVGSSGENLGNRQMAARATGLLEKYERLGDISRSRTGSMMYLDAMLGGKPGYLDKRQFIERNLQQIANQREGNGRPSGFGLDSARRAAFAAGFQLYPSKGEEALSNLKYAMSIYEHRARGTSRNIAEFGAGAQKFTARTLARDPVFRNPLDPDAVLKTPVIGPAINLVAGFNPGTVATGMLQRSRTHSAPWKERSIALTTSGVGTWMASRSHRRIDSMVL